jgi:hypothetical protein
MLASHSLVVPLPAERAIHLFTPVGERVWAPHWAPRFPAGEHGDGSAPGTVFLTGDTHWVVADRAPDRVLYARVTPHVLAGTVAVHVRPEGAGARAEVTYDMTPLTDGAHFDPGLERWEAEIAAALAAASEAPERRG